jgi:hypothetical protein
MLFDELRSPPVSPKDARHAGRPGKRLPRDHAMFFFRFPLLERGDQEPL